MNGDGGPFGLAADESDGPFKDLSVADFERVRDHVHEHSGIYIEDSRFDSLRISLVTRATRLGLSGFAEYFARLARDDEEFRELMNLVTINETSFMRFPGQFEVLRRDVIPELMARTAASRVLRVWSAGCSTGQEAYSIAMTLLDSGAAAAGWSLEVLGTDVSTRALTVARDAVYPARALHGLADDLVARHFEPVGDDRYRVSEAVRRLATFRYHNLIKEPYPLSLFGEWHVIFCRNVTIYFKVESTRRVVGNFRECLVPGGYLFVGHSETLTSITDAFETVEKDGVFLYRRPSETHRLRGEEGEGSLRMPHAPSVAAGPQSARAAASPTTGRLDRVRRIGELVDEGRVALAAGRTTEAHRLARDIGVLDPADPRSPLLDARAWAEEGDLDAAMTACERALATNPLMAPARYLYGVVQMRRGDLEAAERELRRTVYIDAGFALAYLNLATLMTSQERWAEGCEMFEQAARAARAAPDGVWTGFLGGFDVEVFVRTAERGLIECRKASGTV